MAEQVVAFKGIGGKLYATEKEAEDSHAIVPFRKLQAVLDQKWWEQDVKMAYPLHQAVLNLRPQIEEYFTLADKVYGLG